MMNFVVKKTPTGKITYESGSSNIHDDLVLALAFSLYALKQGNYRIR